MTATMIRLIARLATARPPHRISSLQRARRDFTTTNAPYEQIRDPTSQTEQIDVEALLAKPTWSISALLPSKGSSTERISAKQLNHLLRLSALPPPSSAEQEAEMLRTLSSQLHFVRSIQAVDTSGVEPLRSLRDESTRGEKDAELGMSEMQEALDFEEMRGKWHRRIRRKRTSDVGNGGEAWDPLQQAERKSGRYFVVEGGKKAA